MPRFPLNRAKGAKRKRNVHTTLRIRLREAESVLYDYDAVGDIVIPDSVRENAAAAGKAA
jgi:hypothetical protein